MKDKGYVMLSQKRLVPTENGIALRDFLMMHFADVLAYDYTARLEDQLDQIASGRITRLEVLKAFWETFNPQVVNAVESALAQAHSRFIPKPLTLRPAEE
ncbi:MAG: hypothetical protein LCI00_07945 [Chloroflexi bacterium]|nr:hypothetical protein [Chloroflexota bacterium]